MRQKHAPPKKTEPRVCQVCRAPFLDTKQEVKRGWALFCSRKCRGVPRMIFQDRSTGSGPVFDLRKASGLTQKQFAVEVGLSKSLIEKCERASEWPHSIEARQKIEKHKFSF